MDCKHYFEDILNENYQTFMGKSLYTSVKSLTYSYLNIFKILAFASKENILESLPETPDDSDEVSAVKKPFVKLMSAVTNLNETAEHLYIQLFQRFAKRLEEKNDYNSEGLYSTETSSVKTNPKLTDHKHKSASYLGSVDDFLRDRTEIFYDLEKFKHTNFIREVYSLVSILQEYPQYREDSGVKPVEIPDSKRSKTSKKTNLNNITIYHLNGKPKYVGEINKQDKFDGNGFLYHYNGNLLYKGEFVNGEINSENAKTYHFNKNLKYEGKMKSGKMNGPGKLYHQNGILMYDGKFVNDVLTSNGIGETATIYHDNKNMEYQGSLKDGIYSGKGKLYHKNGALE